MCGIAGELRLDEKSPNLSTLSILNETMRPRGPDSEGVYTFKGVGLSHTRLSIIDLNPRAHQPMHLPELGLTIVYNGEIYNYKELREELIQKGHSFFSSSDTEVLMRAYAEWGDKMLEKLFGMFAFAIHHRDSGELFCARDRLGIKPFYYTENNKFFRFSSSLPAIVKAGGIDTSLNSEALHYYMSFHAVVPAPHTILKAVKKLPAAHWMRISKEGKITQERYWDCHYGPDPQYKSWGEPEWEEAVLNALRVSVKRRMVADVPVGLFLSGGTDSSLVAALMAELAGDRLQTFSVGFGGIGSEEGNEFKYSDLVAKHCGTEHHQIEVTTEELLENLPHCIAAMNEPMVSHDNVGFYLLSKFSAQHVKVVQSGQGADEVFAGYSWYPPMKESQNPPEDYGRVFKDHTHEELKSILRPEWMSRDYTQEFINNYFSEQRGLSGIDHALRIDTNVMLVDDPVKRVDSMTMAWSLEARVPFLDHELVQLVARMPSELKLPDDGKYLLKKIAKRFVPEEVIYRKKGYFPVPQLKYIEGPFHDLVKETLSGSQFKSRGLFDESHVEALLKEPKKHITQLGGSKLWQIAVLEMWLQKLGV